MKRIFISIVVMASFLLYSQQCFANKSGNQLTLQHGIVQSAKVIQLDSDAAKDGETHWLVPQQVEFLRHAQKETDVVWNTWWLSIPALP